MPDAEGEAGLTLRLFISVQSTTERERQTKCKNVALSDDKIVQMTRASLTNGLSDTAGVGKLKFCPDVF